MASALLEDWAEKASSKIYSTVRLYNSQPIVTRLFILLFFILHFSAFIFLVFVIGPEQVFNYTAQLAVYLRSLQFPRLTLMLGVSIVSFPPMIGYGTLITLSGMAFGGSQKVKNNDGSMVEVGSLGEAWLVAASACLLGSLISFTVMRSVLLSSSIGRKLTRIDSLRDSRQWRAMEKAVGRRGISMAILVRFSPFPFNISNIFFASLQSVSLANFMIATLTTTPKLLLHVSIGNRLFQLFDRGARAGLDTHAKILNGLYIVVGGLVGIATSYYVYRETNRILSNYEQEEDDEALEQGRSGNGRPVSPWTGPSEERRAFLEEEGITGSQQQYARRSNSALWEAEDVDKGPR